MVSGILDEKKSIPDAHEFSDYRRDSDRKLASYDSGTVRPTDYRCSDRSLVLLSGE